MVQQQGGNFPADFLPEDRGCKLQARHRFCTPHIDVTLFLKSRNAQDLRVVRLFLVTLLFCCASESRDSDDKRLASAPHRYIHILLLAHGDDRLGPLGVAAAAHLR